jgi:hypothetical protein
MTDYKGKGSFRAISQFEGYTSRYVCSPSTRRAMSHLSLAKIPDSITSNRKEPHPHPRLSSGSSRPGPQPMFPNHPHQIIPHLRPRCSSGPSIRGSQPPFQNVSQSTSMRSGFGYEKKQWNLPTSNLGVVPKQGYSSLETSRPISQCKFAKYRVISPANRCLHSGFSDRLQRRISGRYSEQK